ncbi:MAG: hydrogenase maturation peptidase HycI [Dehalococcoidia bacterium]|nr:hydrogenase maturation peptidase HycI [Dehalococcoidia bacterium]
MKTLVLGVGNILNGDDGIGPYIAEGLGAATHDRLHEVAGGRESGTVVALDCGTTPENYTSVVRREQPDLVLIVDAAVMGLPPGEVRLIPSDKMGVLTLSTHNMPLSLLIDYIAEMAGEVRLIGIQPASMLLGESMAEVVVVAGERLVNLIREGRTHEIDALL